MLLINPWFFLLLTFLALWGLVVTVLGLAYILLHRVPKKPSPLPDPPSKIVLP